MTTATGGIDALAAATGETFAPLVAARERTARGLQQRRERLRDVPMDEGATVILLGSWGRHEVTGDSDDDAIVVHTRVEADVLARPTASEVAQALGGPGPGRERLFGDTVELGQLTGNIGLDRDTNTNLTRRMLFLLESVAVAGPDAHAAARQAIVDTYLAAHERDFRPPRFLLNDLIRYWRTIAVDFEGKLRARAGQGWGLRHAKLRFSRKALFAAGLLPVLACADLRAEEMPAELGRRLAATPIDRIATAFLEHGIADAGARAMSAYGEFLLLLDDPSVRAHLANLPEAAAAESEPYQRIRERGDEFGAALGALLFEVPALASLTREYLVF